MEPKIRIIDDLHPEDNAMVQALYSRSPAPVEEHLAKVDAAGSGKFMEKYYVGYGHASIGDCGTTTLFIENVPMIVAKAIQQWPLYSGQESSTRYIDFASQPFLNPLGIPEGERVQEKWREFYLKAEEPLLEHLREKYPRKEGEKESVYNRAIAARGFDIRRAFLPAGALTNLSWHTNLRQASDHLRALFHHPDAVVRDVAREILTELSARYSNSFRQPTDSGGWFEKCFIAEMRGELIYDNRFGGSQDVALVTSGLDSQLVTSAEKDVLEQRKRGQVLPRLMEKYGVVRSSFMLDYGSYRDVQRHRNGHVSFPALTPTYGFHDWYFDSLPEDLREEAVELSFEQEDRIFDLIDHGADRFSMQYYCAMGYTVPVNITQSLPAWVYRVELRSSKMVHPTLRQVVLQEADLFGHTWWGRNVPLFLDTDPDDWDARRGTQTITEK